jgi:hypothetical protein
VQRLLAELHYGIDVLVLVELAATYALARYLVGR